MTTPQTPQVKFCVTGRVDHGKSTLCGHLLYKSGAVTDHALEELRRKAEANKKKGWEYAYILDIYEEEQARGKTVDYNAVPFTHQGHEYLLIDCPGHQTYIRNLITGLNVSQPSETIGCLVVSLAEGEYEAGMTGGQTREDLLLLRAVGITDLVVLMNKIDLVPPTSERYSQIQNALDQHIKKLGFRTVRYHAVSGYYGDGLLELLEILRNLNKSTVPSLISQPSVQVASLELTLRLKLMYDDRLQLLFTAGLGCIMHCGSMEYQIEISGVWVCEKQQRGKVLAFARNGSVIYATVQAATPLIAQSGQSIILRKDDHTIGFGVVV